MTPQEAQKMLLLAFEHYPETRAGYFMEEAKNDPHAVFMALTIAYKELEAYVNTKDYRVFEIDEKTADRVYLKQVIKMSNITGIPGNECLNSENITQLLPPLKEFGSKVMELMKPKPDETEKPKAGIKAEGWNEEQLLYLFGMLKCAELVYVSEANKENFVNTLMGKKSERIKWKGSRKKLTYFARKMYGKGIKPTFINTYFEHTDRKKIDSNDKTSTNYPEINRMLIDAKEI